MVLVETIVPSPDNCRVIRETDPAFVDLVESVKASGVLIPVHVRKHPRGKVAMELLAGERRWRAAKAAGLETIPAIDHGELDDEAAFAITFTENYQRQDLTPLEEGKAAAVLLEKHQGDAKAAAAILGRPEKWVRTRAAIHANLSKQWVKMLNDPVCDIGDWTAGHLALVARLPVKTQAALAEEHFFHNEITVADLDKRIQHWLGVLADAPWDAEDETLVPKAGSCRQCRKRSGHDALQAGLFHDDLAPELVSRQEQCLDPACFRHKLQAFIQRRSYQLRSEYPKLVWVAAPGMEWSERRELSEMYKEKILTHHEWQQTKKTAADAIPAMQVNGKGAGSLKWIRLGGGGSGPARAAKKTKGTERPAVPLKERRAMLDAKRWSQVLIDMQDFIDKAELAALKKQDSFDLARTVPSLAAVFGVEVDWQGAKDLSWKLFDARVAMELEEVMARLWEKVRPELRKRLAYHGAVTRTPKGLLADAGRIGKLIGVEVKDLFDLVAQRKGFTEPKSWGGLKEDGTPKVLRTAAKKEKTKPDQPDQPGQSKKKKLTTKDTKGTKKRKVKKGRKAAGVADE